MNLRFVMSAPGYCRLVPHSPRDRDNYNVVAPLISDGIRLLRSKVSGISSSVHMEADVLHNAYTERTLLPSLIQNQNFGFDKRYADSGGLQIVTAGGEVTPKIKKEIYLTQSSSDYAMCFDEIPARTIEGAASSRTMASGKVYRVGDKTTCAISTAHNIREQIEAFVELESPAKVHYIIQGNNTQDMEDWFNEGQAVLEDEHFDHVAGLSLADTCIGNGQLESADMLAACYNIMREHPQKVKKHVHLLGIGSASRLSPLLYLIKGGFLPEEGFTWSFDSSTYSSGYSLGKFRDISNKIIRPGDNQRIRVAISRAIDFFEGVFKDHDVYCDKNAVLDHMMSTILSMKKTVDTAPDDMYPMVRSLIPLCNSIGILYMTEELARIVDDTKNDNSPIGLLQHVRNSDDYLHWRKHYSKFVQSKRVFRESPSDVSKFFM